MTARLEGYICSRARDGLLGGANGCHFRVRLAGTLVPSFRDDPLAFSYDTANTGIWVSCLETPFGERQCARHCKSIEIAEHHITASKRPLPAPCCATRAYAPGARSARLKRNSSLSALPEPLRPGILLGLGDYLLPLAGVSAGNSGS